jgi:hypothetical protein
MTELVTSDACDSPEILTALNRDCFCLSLDETALSLALEAELGAPGLYELTKARCPYLFSAQPVFVTQTHLQRMREVISAVETVVHSPAWRERLLRSAPAIARHDPGGANGVFMGYDFHVGADSLGLIEINTNAGGALLNALLARAQRACCPDILRLALPPGATQPLAQVIVDMFRREWQLTGHNRPLATVAIVDERPTEQYLYPEFVLFKELFQRNGINAVIAAPEELEFDDGALRVGDQAIDLVYNRLTDFLLEHPANAALRDAYLANAVVLTPHPQAHALYADKRNLALLTDAEVLTSLGVPQAVQQVLLAGIPHTEVVDPGQADRLWAARKGLFFKPAMGYGSKAAWRGDKITRRVWGEILAGDYVAQALVPPGERRGSGDIAPLVFKYDLRNYVYDGAVQWVAARLYQGQTTNFRTPGGGFSPVYSCVPGNPLTCG